MAKQVLEQKIGTVTAYGYARKNGYSGTEEEFGREQAKFGENAQLVAARTAEAGEAAQQSVQARDRAENAALRAEAVARVLPDSVEAWMDENISAPENIVIDRSLTISGAAADSKAAGDELDKLRSVNSHELFHDYSTGNGTAGGITFAWNGHVCTANGTRSGLSSKNLLVKTSGLPDFILPGGQYYASIRSSSKNLGINFFFLKDGNVQSNLFLYESRYITFPADCNGVIIRVEAFGDMDGDTLAFYFLSSMSGREIEERIGAAEEATEELRGNNSTEIFSDFSSGNGTYGGVTFSWNDHTCTASGTRTGLSFKNLLVSENSLPAIFQAGKQYYAEIRSDTAKLGINFFFLKNGTTLNNVFLCESGFVTVPEDCGGMIIRVEAFANMNGETVTFRLLSAMSNRTLGNRIAEVEQTMNGSFIPFTAQCFDPEACEDGKLVNTNGSLLDFAGYSATGYIPLGSAEHFFRNLYSESLTGSRGYCYDRDKNKVGLCTVLETADGITEQVTLSGTAYVRFTLATADKSRFSVYPTFKPSGDFIAAYGSKKAPDWVQANGSGTVIQQNITKNSYADTYQNTYNITTTPSITTDSHGWLASVDTDTQDESGKTDMTGPILSLLRETGYCHLGEGIFYVSGNIDMPDNAMIEGCGAKTVLRLLSSVSDGYILRPRENNTIRNLALSGGPSAPSMTLDGGIGNRHGILFRGNADHQEGEESVTPHRCMVDGVFASNFSGGGITCHNSGYSHTASLYVTNCMIHHCRAGINIDYWSEYNRFTNCMVHDCQVACVNNGGNNIFTACTFHGLKGFLIDNQDNDKPNNGHGSCVGCSFNHINENAGNAIEIYNVSNGFVFSGCQIFYGAILLQNAGGILFSGINFGSGEKITVVNGSLTLFQGCGFLGSPTVSVSGNDAVHFDACYTRSGVAVRV